MSDSLRNLTQGFISGQMGRRTFMTRALALGVSLGSVEAIVAACGGGSGGSSSAAPLKWTNWANTGEIARFQQFTQNYNSTHHANVQYTFVPSANNNYFTKLQTELDGSVGPDVFYVGDGDVGKLVANQTVLELTPLLNSSKSQEKPSDYLSGLWGAAKTQSGKIFGVPVDCNPRLLWMNKGVLAKAGITTMPYDLYEKGQWTRDAFQEMLDKVAAIGKPGYVLDTGSTNLWSWCTVNGGKIYDQNGYGQFIGQDDPKVVDAITWLANNIKNKKILYGGSLPTGQGSDLTFIANQTAFIMVGRWDLPEFKASSGLQYDCVPLPSFSGKIEPANVALAYMAINKKTKYPDQAFDFLTNFVSAKGQQFRLQGGGNAVPSIQSANAEQVVLQGNDPAHAKYLLDARNAGWGLYPAEGNAPGLSDDIKTAFDPVFLQGKDVKTTLAQVAAMANPRIQKAMQQSQ